MTKRTSAERAVLTDLPVAMTGRASPAKAAVGDEPVFAYIRSLPEPQRSIAERIYALAAETLPGLQRAVKWGIAWYGVGDGWCFACGGFEGHVTVAFGRHVPHARPAREAGRHGQGPPGRGPGVARRPGRGAGGLVDAAGRGAFGLREALRPTPGQVAC